MIWQDAVFLVGSMTSVAFLYPTLRNTAARVPRATSVPSMIIGGVYSLTFFSLGMTFSAVGSFAACTMWSLIAALRAPDSGSLLCEVTAPVAEWRTSLVRRLRESAGGAGTPRAETAEDSSFAPHSD